MKDKINTILLIVIACGIWMIALKGLPATEVSNNEIKKVRVVNDLDVRVKNSIDVEGYLDVNLAAINGKSNAFYKDNDGQFMVIPVVVR